MKKGKEYIVGQYNNCQVVKYNYYFENKEECENYRVKDSEQVIDIKLVAEDYENFKWVMTIQEVRAIEDNGRFNMTLHNDLNDVTWKDYCKTFDKFDADYCNKMAHEVIAAREKNTIMELILSAAKSGCFSTIIPDCHIDTRNWLENLGFNVYYSNSYHVEWKDNTH